jgi:hypothetical protein
MKQHLFKRIIFLLFVCSTLVLNFAAAPSLAAAQSGSWSSPVNISTQQINGWFPDITSDYTGRVHVTWAADGGGFDMVHYTSSMDGVNWTKINDITAVAEVGTDVAATRPAMWVDSNGFLNLSYVSITLYFTRAPINSATSAAAWQTPKKMNGSQVSYFSRLFQDKLGQLHLFYTENVVSASCKQCYHLFHRTSADNGNSWSAAQDISADGTGVAKPQVIADDKGGLFVVWESGPGGGQGQLSGPSAAKFTASSDYGKTWRSSIAISPPTVPDAKDVTIGLDGSGRLVAAWLGIQDNTVYYLTSNDTGRTWSRSVPINGIAGSWNVYSSKLDDYSMVTDSSGVLHLILTGQLVASPATATPTLLAKTSTPTPTQPVIGETPPIPAATLNVLHLTWQNDAWSAPDVVATLTGDVPEWPRVAISSGNVLNVVWFVRDQANIWNSDNGHYTIWYSRKELNLPAAPTVVPAMPSATQTLGEATPTTLVSTAPAVLSLPILTESEKLPARAASSEDDYVALLAKSVGPAALLTVSVGILLLFLRRRR